MQCCAEYSITRRLTRLQSLTLYSVDMSTAFDETSFFVTHFAPIYPQNFQIQKFAQRIDDYRVLFISE